MLILSEAIELYTSYDVTSSKRQKATILPTLTDRKIILRAEPGLKSLSTRGPGRRDTCHLTDFSQTFTDD